jgi:hypothetical protein
MGEIKEFDDYIIFKEDTHQYFRKHDNVEFTSVSKFLSKFSIPFDKATVSRNMTSSKEEQQELLEEWEAISKESTDHGKLLHGEAENLIKFGQVKDRQFAKLGANLYPHLKMYKRNFSEKICYNDSALVAGTADWPAQRNLKGDHIILDINDFKTNIRNGIRNYNGKIDPLTKAIKYYKKYFLQPIEYLEASDYNKYVLQLSIYAFMFELIWDNVKIGALNIFYIDQEMNVTKMPVPYLRPQVISMFERFGGLKSIDPVETLKKINAHTKAIHGRVPEYSGESLADLLGGNSNGNDTSTNEYW